MKIQFNNTKSRIVEFPPSPWDKQLLKAFTKKAKNAFWAQRRVKGWSGSTRFISPTRGEFPSGILPLILDWAKDNDIEVEIDDKRQKPRRRGPKFTDDILPDIELRDYQVESVKAVLKEHRGLIKASTGAGKTFILIALCKTLGIKTLVVVERVNLATQTRNQFLACGFDKKDVGVVGGEHNYQQGQVTIATVQSSHKLTNLKDYKMVIVDESHHSKAKTYIKLLKQLTNAYYRIGLSGTVFGDDPVDDMYRIAQFGPVIYEIGTKTLIERGVLSKPTIRMIQIEQPFVGHISHYMNMYKAGIANNYIRNNIIAKFGNGFRGKTLILFRLIEHGQELKRLIPKAMYADGDTPAIERQRMIDGFNRSPEAVLIASTILDEGIDFSSIHHLIVAGGEKSIIKGIQRLGRGLRSDGPNDQVNVIDFMDKTSNVLERHSKKRMRLYKEEGHTVKLITINMEE